MKRILVSLSLFLVAALGSASVRAAYRIVLKDGTVVLARDLPVHRGSVVMFHLYPKGPLTSVPEEEVVGETTTVREVSSHLLQPGDVVVLGATGGGQTPAPATQQPSAGAMAPATPGGVYDPRNPMYGGYAAPISPNGQTLNLGTGAIPPPGDLARAQSGTPPTLDTQVAPNGFPSTPGSTPVAIGPDGTPILAPAGTPGSAAPAIGLNGTPVLAPPGAPGSAAPAIGPNGTPILAPPGAPGSTQPPIGSNGTPNPSGQKQ